METTSNSALAAAFVKAQKAFAPALKNSNNPAFKSKYADLASCIDAVIDALNANGLALIQIPSQTDDEVMVETRLLHESGEERIFGSFSIPVMKHDAHGTMSALTYCRRASLMTAMGIAPEDDDGNRATKGAQKDGATKPQSPPQPATWADAEFAAALTKHGTQIVGGKKTATDLIAWMTTKAPITDAQRAVVFYTYCRGCGSIDAGCQCMNDE